MRRADSAYLLVRAGGRRVGLPLAAVVEVLDPGAAYPVPALEPAVRGVVAVRGTLLPLVDLGALLAGRPCAATRGGAAVVVQMDGRQLCLEVDDAEEVLRDAGLPVPAGAALPWAAGVARHPEGLVPLLDLTALGARITEAAAT
ncbi:MAG: chemotaxis protein CheW [Gemmatimonadales bacterium]|nr:chemotaxis protein CheW [Gemmatimonadales bacterium]MBA3553849.1 chemotaxis protein CheW [Gemmatimonadales bacterium]